MLSEGFRYLVTRPQQVLDPSWTPPFAPAPSSLLIRGVIVKLLSTISTSFAWKTTEQDRRAAYLEVNMEEESNAQVEGGVVKCGTSPEDVQAVS